MRRSSAPAVAQSGTDWHPQKGDTALVLALARGASVPEAAAEAGISERTAWRRVADRRIQRCVAEARAELVSQAVAQLAETAAKAVKTLGDVMDCDDPRAATAAAKVVLEYALPMQVEYRKTAEALRVVRSDLDLVLNPKEGPDHALPALLAEPETEEPAGGPVE